MSKFDEMLIYLRKRADLTQVELAKKLGVSRSTIGNYEKGIRTPDYEMLEKIADFFNVDLNFLLGKSGNEADLYKRYAEAEFKEKAEKEILRLFRKLNSDGQDKVRAYMEDLICLEKYTEPSTKADYAS